MVIYSALMFQVCKTPCLFLLITMILKSIVYGELGNHGLLVLRHAEVELVRKIELSRLQKLMEVHALETGQKRKHAMSRIVQVRL